MTNSLIFEEVCARTSQMVTAKYSTSFSKAIMFLPKEIRENIYNIYGFVRIADEIVDTFHEYDKRFLLDQFCDHYRTTLQQGISFNPILHAFCRTQKKYEIPQDQVDAFLNSMKMDLGEIKDLNDDEYHKYIYGSAEVVGLMCLRIFVQGDEKQYENLKSFAQSFGAALQKVNFLRDISADFNQLSRTYFPQVNFIQFTEEDKKEIELDIENDFKMALKGIRKLPHSSRFAVYLAYKYYLKLFNQIRKTSHTALFNKRIRVPDYEKSLLLINVLVRRQLNLF